MLSNRLVFLVLDCPAGATFSRRSPRKSVDRYTRRDENFVLVRSNRAITVAAQNRRLALMTNILSRASDGAVPVAARDIKGAARRQPLPSELVSEEPQNPEQVLEVRQST